MTQESVERVLGRLSEAVEGLRRDFDSADKAANAERTLVYTRLQQAELESTKRHAETQAALVAIVTTQVTDAARIADMEPEIESFRRMRQRGIGVLAAVGIISTLLGVTVADGWDKILAGIQRFFGLGG